MHIWTTGHNSLNRKSERRTCLNKSLFWCNLIRKTLWHKRSTADVWKLTSCNRHPIELVDKTRFSCVQKYIFPPFRRRELLAVCYMMHFRYQMFAWWDLWNWIALNNTTNMPHITRMENIWLKPKTDRMEGRELFFLHHFFQRWNAVVFVT